MTHSAPELDDVQLLIFDLDGTLIDSGLDLAMSVNSMRERLGLPRISNQEVATFVGHGVANLVRKSLGNDAPEEKVQEGIEFFLAYYRQHMLDNTVTYPGVREALEDLKGRHLTVLTNKPVRFSELILEGLGIAGCFRYIYGGNSFEQKKPDPVGANKLMEDLQTPPRRTMIIGDSDTDVLTGKNAGIWTCGATYGFGAPTLKNAPPDFSIQNLRELPRVLDGHRKAESSRR